MDPEILTAFDASRSLSNKSFRSGCYAPYTSLYFDTRGNVRVCCHNWSNPVGNINQNTLTEIWRGPALAALRTAVKQYDFSLGCEFCEWQVSTQQFVNVPVYKWDRLTIDSEAPEWPQVMEFSISNQCNLECVMCDGTFSSAIRQRREKLPPISNCYSDEFFSELRSYLPHLRAAKFLGGEPFLEPEAYRIWEMLIEAKLPVPVGVTTNGTQYNARVQRILDLLPVGIVVSLDAVTKQTYESIRVNADFEKVMTNVRKFHEYCRTNNRPLGLTYCLMRPNWHEFAEFCVFCEGLGSLAWVNIVRRPPHLSLYTLATAELVEIVAAMEKQGQNLQAAMGRNYSVWHNELTRLRNRCLGVLPPNLIVIEKAAVQ